MAELKKCPFCGSDKLKIEKKKKGTRYFGIAQLENYTASVRCNVCHARGGTVSGYVRNRKFVEADNWLKDEISIAVLDRSAIEAWNNRVTEAEIRAKAIEEFLEKLKAELLDALRIFSERREMYEIESDMGKMYTHGIGTLKGVNHMIDEIAEQLKEREE